jgi:choline kinase
LKVVNGIILAAGPGSRLAPLTDELPKCLLPLGKHTVLSHTFNALRKGGVGKLAVVVGHMRHKIMKQYPELTYYVNSDFRENNILKSLFYAEESMDNGFIVSYSDIIFPAETIEKLQKAKGDIVLVVDVDWRERYEGRTEHPTDEAELVVLDERGQIRVISKFVNPDAAYGEFIGVAKFSTEGSRILRQNYHRARENKWCGYTERFQDARSIDAAYLTDMIQELIDRYYSVQMVEISRGWVEIDTHQDLEYARRNFSS